MLQDEKAILHNVFILCAKGLKGSFGFFLLQYMLQDQKAVLDDIFEICYRIKRRFLLMNLDYAPKNSKAVATDVFRLSVSGT